MPVELVTVPCLSDNYAFLFRDSESGEVALVDVPEADPIIAALEARGWSLDHVLITHHHADHVQGLDALKAKYQPRVVGAASDQARLPQLDLALEEGERFEVGATQLSVLDVSGHTIGHIAYVDDANKIAYTADSLMALGCGRVFEGTFPQMWNSLSKLAALSPETTICSGHEYTAANAKFALTIEPDNEDLRKRVAEISEKRAKGLPTVPTRLSLELKTNPFLRAGAASVKTALGLEGAEDAEVFAEIRRRKDAF